MGFLPTITFGRVFSRIDAQQFQLAFWEWVCAVNELIQGQVINIDGKCLRGSDDEALGKRAIYIVSAWAAENEIVLGQRKVDEKSNEITAIPELLKILSVSGCIVTMDAMGTQTNIAKTIVEAQADNVLSVKENQGHLFEDISVLFAVDQASDFKYASYEYKKTTNKEHGRIEIRECYNTSNPAHLRLIRSLDNWVGLKSIVSRRMNQVASTGVWMSIDGCVPGCLRFSIGTKDQPLAVIKSIRWNQTARRVVKPAGLWLIEPPLFSR